MYALVLVQQVSEPSDSLRAEHREFVIGLIDRHQVLLGGSWGEPAGGFMAAYLLRVDSLMEAQAIAATDPYVRWGTHLVQVVEWQIVAIDPQAIDPSLT